MTSELPIITRASGFPTSIALRTEEGEYTYQSVLDRSKQVALSLLHDKADLEEARVAILIPPGIDYVAAMWGTWRAGGIALPICLSATEPEWEYALTDSGAVVLLVSDQERAQSIRPLCNRLAIQVIVVAEVDESSSISETALPMIKINRRAMILYTSGTTSKPKGVVTTHANIQAQIESLVQAWEWDAADHVPLFLPLHHIHGIINIMSCALWSGASVEMFSRFDLATIFDRVRHDAYTVFMAVPTIYTKLIEALEKGTDNERIAVIDGFKKLRLMVSGSAALPASVHEKWSQLTGQALLERYGMTEIGMALSNPYRGKRLPGYVGLPLPNVEVRLKNDAGEIVSAEEQAGEIQIRGPGVFAEYWNRRETTVESFDDGWFRTGDIAVVEAGYYRIMGRRSVDIIKSGGYKLSALEIEAALLDHPSISECAVVGIPDETWGEAVAVAVVIPEGVELDLESLRNWSRDRLSYYKIPKRWLVVERLPRNAMGKVTKPAVRELFRA